MMFDAGVALESDPRNDPDTDPDGCANDDGEPKSALVYKYGVLSPSPEALELVREQMFLARRYYNILVAIGNEQRDRLRAAEASHGDVDALRRAYKAASEELSEAQFAIRVARQRSSKPRVRGAKATPTRKVDPALTERAERAKQAKADARQVWYDARTRLHEDKAVINRRDTIQKDFALRKRMARAESSSAGLYSGSYLLVERSHRQAMATRLWDKEGDPQNLKPHRSRDEGQIGVQIVKDRQVEPDAMFRPNLLAWMDPVDPRAWCREEREGNRRRLSRTVLHLRVASNERHAVMVDFPMVMHRAFPEKAKATWAILNYRRVGTRDRWAIDFTLDTTMCPPYRVCGKGRVAVNIGWRQLDDGVRVAMCVDDEGHRKEIRLDDQLVNSLRRHETIQARRDVEFDVAKAALSHWLRGKGTSNLPEGLRRAVCDRRGQVSVGLWKSQRRLTSLCWRWAKNRFDGDSTGDNDLAAWKQAVIDDARAAAKHKRPARRPPLPTTLSGFASLEAWRYHDWHLLNYQESARKSSLRRRKDFYRREAADLARTYGSLVLHVMPLAKFAKRAETEQEQAENERARSNRHMAATAELIECLKQAFLGRRGKASVQSSTNITQIHAGCGMLEPFDAAASVMHKCSQCGATYDQDVNACENLLGRHGEQPSDDEDPGTARSGRKRDKDRRPGETTWDVAKRKHAEREDRMSAARKADDNTTETQAE